METLNFLEKYSNKSSKIVYVTAIESPIGEVVAAADEEYLYTVIFKDSKALDKTFKILSEVLSFNFKQQKNDVLKQFEEELKSYLSGNLKKFTIPIKTYGSEFQKVLKSILFSCEWFLLTIDTCHTYIKRF